MGRQSPHVSPCNSDDEEDGGGDDADGGGEGEWFDDADSEGEDGDQ